MFSGRLRRPETPRFGVIGSPSGNRPDECRQAEQPPGRWRYAVRSSRPRQDDVCQATRSKVQPVLSLVLFKAESHTKLP
jgi:hypothetical protein